MMGNLLAKILDSFAKGFLGKMLAGAGLTLASTAVMTTLVNQYISTLKNQTAGISVDMLAILHLSGLDFALSVILSAIVARMTMNATNLTLKKATT